MSSELAFKIQKETKNCNLSLTSIREFLDLMQSCKKEYSEFRYQGNGSVALVLKAKKNGKDEVALKVVEQNEQTYPKIEAMKGRQALMRDLSFSNCFVEVNDQFVLHKSDDGRQSSEENSNSIQNSFFVQEMQQYQENLSEILQQCKQDKKSLTGSIKETLAIQILDAVNLLHQKNVTHGDIKTQNFLVSSSLDYSILLKLKIISPTNLRNQTKEMLLKQDNLSSVHSETDGIPKDCIEQDLISLGILLLELDNVETFDSQTISDSEKNQLCDGKIFETHQLNRSSLLYSIACTLLSPQNNRRDVARTVLLRLLESSKDYAKIPVFSVVTKMSINSVYKWNIHQIISQKQQYLQVKGSETEDKLKAIRNQFTNTKGQERKELTVDLLKSALEIMLSWEDFQGQFDLLGVGATSVVFGVENLKEQRKSVLKLSLCTNKAETIRQIGIMRICQNSNIVKFYSHKFFEDSNHNLFVVYELERCKYSLKHYLEQQRTLREYSQQSKHLLMIQIMDSVNFLHKNCIIHRDIKLDRFLITQNEQGQAIAKLSNFNHASQLQECFIQYSDLDKQIFERQYYSSFNCIIRSYNNESLMYFAPERWENPYPATYQTDSFSVGLCLILLDNFFMLSEEQLAEKLSSFTSSYDDLFKDKNILVNSNTEIYSIAKQFLSYQPNERKCIKDLIDRCTQSYCEDSNLTVLPVHKNLQQVCMDVANSQDAGFIQLSSMVYPEQNMMNLSSILLSQNTKSSQHSQEQVLQCSIASLSNVSSIHLDLYCISKIKTSSLLSPLSDLKNLSNISLILDSSLIGTNGAQTLLRPISSLANLSSISLELYDNLIGGKGADYLLQPLSNLINLSSISLNVNSNSIGDLGASQILSPLTNLINLSVLKLTLQTNQIGDQGASSLLIPLTNLINLSSISLNLRNNQIGSDGAKHLLYPLANLINLSSFSLNLDSNSIGDDGTSCLLNPLTNLVNLKTISINLGSNSIGSIGASSLLCPLTTLKDLVDFSLNLFYNKIGDDGASSLLLPLSDLTSLQSISLNLISNSIEATGGKSLLLPLSKLINLTSVFLHLWCNNIGEIGGSSLLLPLANLQNLTNIQLNFNSNSIGDVGAQSLLTPLANLCNLSSISLEGNKNLIGKIGASSLLTPLANLLNLKNISLELAMNPIESAGAESLLSPLTNFVNLQTLNLNLYYTLLESTGTQSILLPLTTLVNLSKISLNFDNNQIDDITAQCLLSPITNLIKLSSLSLSFYNNCITEIGAQSLLTPLRNLLNLKSMGLLLDGNTIGDLGAQSLLCPLSGLINLQDISINLTNNQIGDAGASSLLTPISNLVNLSAIQLLLSNNQIGNLGSENLLSPLKNLLKLSTIFLSLEDNQIEAIGAQSLLSPIANLTTLSKIIIDLNYNQISDIGAQHLLVPLNKLTNLSIISLNLNSNEISDIGIQSLLLPFVGLPNLLNISLGLDSNSIDDTGIQYLFSFISLNLLDLDYLQLQITQNSNTKQVEHLFKQYLTKVKELNVSE